MRHWTPLQTRSLRQIQLFLRNNSLTDLKLQTVLLEHVLKYSTWRSLDDSINGGDDDGLEQADDDGSTDEQ